MSAVTTSLRLNDQMNSVLRGITTSLNMTLSAMDDMKHSMDSSFDNSSIEAAKRSIQETEAALDGLTPPIGQAEKEQQRFNRSLQDGEQDGTALLKTITGFIGAYMGFRSVTRLLSGGLDIFKEYEQSMARVRALSGATNSEFQNLSQTARHLGETTNYSASQVADGMGFLAMAGFETNEIIEAMPGLLSTATAGQIELAQAADITSNILSGFNMNANETSRVADVLTAAFTSANIDLQMLGETMKYVAPNASAVGYELEEVAAAAGLLGDAGIQASMAGTSLRSIISRMSAPTGAAATAMRELDINVTETDGSLKGLAAIIDEVSAATEHMGDTQRLAAVKTLVGEEAASSFLTLMASGGDALREFTDELENSAGKAEEIADIMLNTTAGKIAIFHSQLESAWINFYEGLSDGQAGEAFQIVLDGIVSALQLLLPILEQIIIAASAVVVFFQENWTWIEPILVGLGTALMGIVLILGLMAVKWTILNTVMKANPILLIISLVIGLIAALVNLWMTNDAFVAGFLRAWNAVLNFFDQIPIFFVRVGMGIVNAFNSAKVNSLKIMQQLINGVISGINSLIQTLNRIPGVTIEAIGQVEFAASAAIEAEAVRQQGEALIQSMQSNADRKALEREQRVLDRLESRAEKRAQKQGSEFLAANTAIAGAGLFDGMDGVGGAGGIGSLGGGSGLGGSGAGRGGKANIGKVDEVGKIKDKVDISSEDLKMMRELAEQQNIQNFVTLTPTVSVQTGDIRETADIDTIVSRITTTLEEQIASSASGVYG